MLAEQKKALDEITALRSIIPICSIFRKVKDDEVFLGNREYLHAQAHGYRVFPQYLSGLRGASVWRGLE
jgi:hypothetical protein